MATSAKAYRNPEQFESENSSPFTRIAQVRASTLAERHRNLLVAMLYKNRFGDELWMSTDSVAVVMGRVCYRRKTAETDTLGRRLGACDRISRRAVQRLIDEVVGLGILTQVYDANRRVPYGGSEKFRHTATYRLNPDKLVPRKTHDEYVEERDRGRANARQAHREATQREHADVTPIRKPAQPAPSSPLPPAPAAPLPRKAAVEDAASNKLTRTERRTLAKIWVGLMAKKQSTAPVAAEPSTPAPAPDRDPWLKILRHLETRINRHSFETWLRPTRFGREDERVLYVRVPSEQFVHGGEKYAGLIQQAIDSLGLPLDDVKFVTAAPEAMQTARFSHREAAEKARQLLSTKARPFALEDVIVALRLEGFEFAAEDKPASE